MDRRHGYQLLAMLLKQKRPLLNSHILHLVFGLVGTVDARRETGAIPNVVAFTELLCDLSVSGARGGGGKGARWMVRWWYAWLIVRGLVMFLRLSCVW